jgi:hypothetical protein
MFSVLDVHDEVYLVARVEKVLDGNNLHSAITPYLSHQATSTDTGRIKAAVKLNKKMQQIVKTKLAAYRQPFAWAAK